MFTIATDQEVTNAGRAAWAEEALETFTRRVYGGHTPQQLEHVERADAIADLICDLLHLARLYEEKAAGEAPTEGCGATGPEGFRCTHHENGLHVARGTEPDAHAESWKIDPDNLQKIILERAGAMFLTECREDA